MKKIESLPLLPLLASIIVLLVLSCAPALASNLAVQPLNECTSQCCICFGPGRSTYCNGESGYPDCYCPNVDGDEANCAEYPPSVAR